MLELRGNDLLIWLAALIDGEGSIMLNKRHYSRQEAPRRNDHYRASVVIAGTDVGLLETIVVNTGVCRIYSHRVNGDPRSPQKRQQWTWRLGHNDIRMWLPAIRPYLVVKGQQADLLMEALAIKDGLDPSNKGHRPTDRPSMTLRMGCIYTEISLLNRRGRITLC